MIRRSRQTDSLLLCSAIALAACAGTTAQPTRSDLAESAVGIVAEGCSLVAQLGSGVVLELPGQIITAAHPIKGAKEITVIDSEGIEHDATVRAFDKDRDLAVLDAPTLRAAPLTLGADALGSAILLVWSRDDGAEAKAVDVVKHLQITIEDIYVDEIVQRTGLEINGDIEIGDSGGAIVTGDGEVIGIVYASSRERGGIGFSTDSAEIRGVLSERSTQPVPNGHCT
jgi:S1-C subfamily serine protease